MNIRQCDFRVPEMPFGISGERYVVDLEPRITAKETKKLGATCNYISISWADIEPAKGVWDFTTLDIQLNRSKLLGLETVVRIFTGANEWSTIPDPNPNKSADNKLVVLPRSLMPKDMSEYANFLTQIVKRCKGSVRYYEIQNEISDSGHWPGSPKDYHELLKASYTAIKAEDPQALILEQGFASPANGHVMAREYWENGEKEKALEFWNTYFYYRGDSYMLDMEQLEQKLFGPQGQRHWEFLKDYCKINKDYFDCYQWHFYDNWCLTKEVIQWVKRKIREAGADKPIMAHEYGYHLALNLYDPQKYAEFIAKRFIIAISEGVDQIMLQPPARLSVTDPLDKQRAKTLNYFPRPVVIYSLQENEWKLTQCGEAYSFLAHSLKGVKNFFDVEIREGITCYKVETFGGGVVWIMWNNEEKNAQVDISSLTDKGEIFDIYGIPLYFEASNIMVGTAPVYIIEKNLAI